MKYHAFFGELPINAFQPRNGKFGGMTLEGGGGGIGGIFDSVTSAVEDAVSPVVSAAEDVAKPVVNTVEEVAKPVVNAAENVVSQATSNPLTAAALIGAGAYFAPEIGAWIGSNGAVVPGSEAVAPSISGIDLGGGLSMTPEGSILGGTSLGTSPTNAQILSSIGVPAAAGAAGAAAGGTALSSMLPYMAASQLGAGLLQANAAQKAAAIQGAAAQGATQLQGQMFNAINQQQAPYRTAGYQGLNQLNALGAGPYVQYDASGNPIGTAQGSGYLTHQFSPEDFAAGIDPGYAFRLQQGQMANQRAANVGGGALSGNTLAGLQAYTQGQASQEYGNAFNRYQAQRQNIYNTLAGIAGIGQGGQTQANQAAQNYGTNVANLGIGAAGAQAAGLTGATNALGTAAGNIANTYLLSSLLGQSGRVA